MLKTSVQHALVRNYVDFIAAENQTSGYSLGRIRLTEIKDEIQDGTKVDGAESTVGPGKSSHDGNRYQITLKAHSSYCSLRVNASGSSVILRMFVQ